MEVQYNFINHKILYTFSDDRLKGEIEEIEDLYKYVKSLVKTRLNQNAPVEVEISQVEYSI